MVQGQVFLGGGWHFSYLIFSSFIILSFSNLELLYPLQNCVMHLKKKYFFRHHNFKKKGHSKLSKNEPENLP